LNLDFFSQLSSIDLSIFYVISLSLLSSIGVATCTVLWLTLAKTDPDIALEPDIVGARELEGVEYRCENSLLAIVLPFSKYRWICCTSILISDQVLVLIIVIHSVGHTASGESSVNCIRLNINFEHESITNLCSVDIFSI